MKNSTIESHLKRRIIAQREVHYCWCTPTDTLLECSAIHEPNAPTKMKDLQTRAIAPQKCTYSRLHDTSEDRLKWLRMRKDMRCRIWDELRAHGSKDVIQNSTACGTVTMAHASVYGAQGQRSETHVRVRDMLAFWHKATIMRGEPGNTLIAEAIIVVANPRGWHNIVNTQLGQPEGRGVSSVMLSPAKLVICILANRLLWLSLYE